MKSDKRSDDQPSDKKEGASNKFLDTHLTVAKERKNKGKSVSTTNATRRAVSFHQDV